MSAQLAGFVSDPFDDGSIEHDVFRRGDGPAVLVLHEVPGIDGATLAVAERIRCAGFTIVLPDMLPPPFAPASPRLLVGNMIRVCVAREFWALALRYDRPLTRWLQALAVREHGLAGGPGIGIVGMCLTGGFALAAATQAPVAVAIASEPAVPFRVRPGASTDLGMSEGEVQVLADRVASGELCVRAFAYDRDPMTPPARMERIKSLLGSDVVIEGIHGKDHPVLDRAVGWTKKGPGTPDPEAVPALTETLRVLRETLLPGGSAPAPA
jgi:dienelactone hydrolase